MDFTAFDAAVSEINVISASLQSTISGDVAAAVAAQKAADASALTAAVAAQQASDQSDFDARMSNLQAAIGALQTAASGGGTTAPPPPVVINTTSVTTSLGTPSNTSLDVSGGTPPYTFAVDPGATQPPADVTVSADGVLSIGGQTAETGSVNVIATDSTGAVSPSTAISISVA